MIPGFLILWAVLAAASWGDPHARRGPLVVAAALAVSLVLDHLPWRAAVRALGLGRPGWRALAVSAATSALVLLVWPVTALLCDTTIPVRRDWPLILIGVLTLNGLAEESITSASPAGPGDYYLPGRVSRAVWVRFSRQKPDMLAIGLETGNERISAVAAHGARRHGRPGAGRVLSAVARLALSRR